MPSAAFIDVDGSPLRGQLLGVGGSGVVVKRDNVAIKVPRMTLNYPLHLGRRNYGFIEYEKEIYRRLHGCEGVVRVIRLDIPGTIHMELMSSGNLFSYLRDARQSGHYPPRTVQLWWFRQLATALVAIHERRVFVVSLFTRNLLLSFDLRIKFSDFGRSIILPMGADMRTASSFGYTAAMDIGQFGMIMYQVIMGGHYHDFGFFFCDAHPGPEEPVWPAPESFPTITGLWLEPIIRRCWTPGGFDHARALLEALEAASV